MRVLLLYLSFLCFLSNELGASSIYDGIEAYIRGDTPAARKVFALHKEFSPVAFHFYQDMDDKQPVVSLGKNKMKDHYSGAAFLHQGYAAYGNKKKLKKFRKKLKKPGNSFLAPLFQEDQEGRRRAYEELSKSNLKFCAAMGDASAQFSVAKTHSGSEEEVFFWMYYASCQGNRRASATLAYFLEHGKACNKDPRMALSYYLKAVEGENPRGIDLFNVAACYKMGVGASVDLEKAKAFFKSAVRAGDDESWYELGKIYSSEGTYDKAMVCLEKYLGSLKSSTKKEMSKNKPKALSLRWAAMFNAGQEDKAVKELYAAADKGSTNAMYLLAEIYAFGSYKIDQVKLKGYIEANRKKKGSNAGGKVKKGRDTRESTHLEAFYWLKKPGGHEKARELLEDSLGLGNTLPKNWFMLGKLYETGPNKDLKKAEENLKKAYDHGYKTAALSLGHILMNKGSEEADRQAQLYFKEVIHQGHPTALRALACYNLGMMGLSNRLDLSEDKGQYAVARSLLKASAKLGDPDAACITGDFYAAESKFSKALEYYQKAEGSSDEAALKKVLILLLDTARSDEERGQGLILLSEISQKESPLLIRPLDMIKSRLMESHPEISGVIPEMKFSSKCTPQEDLIFQRVSMLLDVLRPEEDQRLGVGQDWKSELANEGRAIKVEEEQASSSSKGEGKPTLRPIRKKVIESLTRNKNQKFRKVKKYISLLIDQYGGSMKNHHGGSGKTIKIGAQVTGFHVPHGRDSTQLDKAALKELIKVIENLK